MDARLGPDSCNFYKHLLGLHELPGSRRGNFYRPLTMFWLFLVNQIGHGAPGFFHIGVVLVHLVVMLEIYFLGRRLTKDAVVGAVAALLFGIHPTHIESVAWISGISDVLCAAFFLAALLAICAGRMTANGTGWPCRWCAWRRRCSPRRRRRCCWCSSCWTASANSRHGLVFARRPRDVRFAAIHRADDAALLLAVHILAQRSARMEVSTLEPSAALAPYALWWYLKKQVLPYSGERALHNHRRGKPDPRPDGGQLPVFACHAGAGGVAGAALARGTTAGRALCRHAASRGRGSAVVATA